MRISLLLPAFFLFVSPLAMAQDWGSTVIEPDPQPVQDTAQETAPPIEEIPLAPVDEGVPLSEQMPVDGMTEAEFAAQYVDYRYEPETTVIARQFTGDLTGMSALDLGLALGRLEQGMQACTTLRQEMEARIGDRPGSYSVRPAWVKRYQNCIAASRADINAVGEAIRVQRAAAIERLGDEGATLEFEFLDKLSIRHAQIRMDNTNEARLQRDFVSYFNTGVKEY